MSLTTKPLSSANEFWDQMLEIGFVEESFGCCYVTFDLIGRSWGADLRTFGWSYFHPIWRALGYEDN